MSDSQNPTPPSPPSDAPPPPPASPPPPSSPPPGGGFGASGAGAGGPHDGGPRLPWLDRKEKGFVEAYVETAKLVVQQPAEAFSRIRADGDYVSPLLFAGIVMMAATLFNILFSIVWGMLFSGSSGMGALAVAGGIGIFMAGIVIVVAPIFIVIFLFLLAGIFHLILNLTGGLNASRAGFEGSFQLVCYAAISYILAIVPLIGGLLGLAGLGYLSYVGLPRVHGCTERHALYALIPLAICGGCGAIGMIFNTLSAMF